MIINITTVLAVIVTIIASVLALGVGAVVLARLAGRQARAARVATDLVALKVADLEALLASTAGELKALAAERERERATPTRPSLREAVALSRHGATTEELVATCRIGQGEARLIQMLYGELRQTTVRGSDSN